jgi:hypothetical protein
LVKKESDMLRQKTITWFATLLCALVAFASSAHAADIGGTISATMAITQDSQLIDDVTCTVTDVPCLDIVASNVTLELNGFSMTGLADPQTGCMGISTSGPEMGIRILNQTGVTIHGPGIIQRFRVHGIIIQGSTTGTTITGVTASTNCASGFLVGGNSNVLENNISIRNGALGAPCGGI